MSYTEKDLYDGIVSKYLVDCYDRAVKSIVVDMIGDEYTAVCYFKGADLRVCEYAADRDTAIALCIKRIRHDLFGADIDAKVVARVKELDEKVSSVDAMLKKLIVPDNREPGSGGIN